MTDDSTNTDTGQDDGRNQRRAAGQAAAISGDPGIGALLADPEEAVAAVTRHPKPSPGPPTPDPALPHAHGDWAPNRAWHGQTHNKNESGRWDSSESS